MVENERTIWPFGLIESGWLADLYRRPELVIGARQVHKLVDYKSKLCDNMTSLENLRGEGYEL